MTPLQLTLTNFTGIRAGLGRDEITVDLRIAGELVAIVGPNGAGKTTVLDNLHPYRLMPSRATGYAPGSFSYYDHTYGHAAKVLLWEHAGTTYESSIVIKGAGKTKSQECYLHEICADGTKRTVVLPDNTASDGKSATYDACVNHILGSPELFFTTAFACQGRRTLADYTNSDVKTLMSDLLGLDSIREIGDRAKGIAAAARAKLEAVGDARAKVDALRATRDALERETAALQEQDEQCSLALCTYEATFKIASERVLALTQDQAGAALVAQQRERLKRRIADEAAEMQATFAALERRFHDAIGSAEGAYRSAGRQVTAARARVTDSSAKIEALLVTAGLRDSLRQRLDIATAIANTIAPLEVEIAAAEEAAREADAAERAASEATITLRAAVEVARAAKMALEAAERRSALVEQVPCAGMEMQNACQLLADAVAARANLDGLRQDFSAASAAHNDAIATHEAALARRARHGAPPDVAPLRAKLKAAQQTHASLSGLASRIDAADRAAAEADQETERLAALETEVAAATDALADALAAMEQLERQRVSETAAAREANQKRMQAMEAELAALPQADTAALDAAHAQRAEAETKLSGWRRRQNEIEAKLAVCEERAKMIDSETKAAEAMTITASRLENEVAQWTLLAKACGNDGIIALCIDDAGPAIAGLCNDLLMTCYGPRFSVAIETQRETQAGTAKETFDIRVLDADRDESKSIRDVSGGERVYINEAMTRAMALYQAQASGRHYECLFADESDGALDTEKKRQFASMKRRVLEVGGYRREIYISHSAEVQEAADAVIDMEDLRHRARESAGAVLS